MLLTAVSIVYIMSCVMFLTVVSAVYFNIPCLVLLTSVSIIPVEDRHGTEAVHLACWNSVPPLIDSDSLSLSVCAVVVVLNSTLSLVL